MAKDLTPTADGNCQEGGSRKIGSQFVNQEPIMWSRIYSRTVEGLSREEIYAVWSDIDRWPEWLDDVERTRLEGPFAKGVFFAFKPKGGPKLRLEVTEATHGKSFTDVTRFPLAHV
jgi:hypothetical protein